MLHVAYEAIDEAVALFKKRKPSDRDTTQCRVPSSYTSAVLPATNEERLLSFEFTVCNMCSIMMFSSSSKTICWAFVYVDSTVT